MVEWAPKRFWKTTEVVGTEGGFTVHLDGRPVKTPAKAAFVVPTRAMAEAAATEWDAQGDLINPLTMPVTRSVNAALDKVATQKAEVVALIAAYGESDLLCHRADTPAELAARQAQAWDPLLDWAGTALDARLNVICGVLPCPQPDATLAALRAQVSGQDIFCLTALYDLVGLSGSLVIGLAAIHAVAPIERLWEISRIDETWQEEQWGVDTEAAEAAGLKRRDFLHARRFYDLARISA
ncbi:chaperone required for assembly of F1-ATPase [Rhodovulum bhavnagarense]|uniref:Chaperone required for assembly of F1-ATPase n=1 Tax=Rhodovulum bhavnagarense TaxID=992286 RepID=A0A4R2RDW1_9RHOB|nr:ATP12 family protein [Rhodovulum bhavnagarense]TCP60399.1 chaperone required for assembly of F1-ATPase [Rhodovulum bhavnagarense]